MRGVGRREAGDMDEAARDQPGKRGVLRGGGEQRVERQRHRADRLVELRFRRGEAGGEAFRHAGAHGEAAVEPAGIGRAQLAFELGGDGGAMHHA